MTNNLTILPAMTTAIDLEAYFQRIGYTGERKATLDVLRNIQLCHTETIAFETLESVFRSTLPDVPELDAVLMKITASTE